MAKSSVEIEGIDLLLAKLQALGGNAEKALHKGLMQGGKVVQSTAKKLCPVDTGALRNSIAVKDCAADRVEVGTNVEYAPYVEFGTGQRGDPSVAHKSEWIGQPTQPFLSPALALSEQAVKQCVSNAVKKSIKEAAGSG